MPLKREHINPPACTVEIDLLALVEACAATDTRDNTPVSENSYP